MSRTLDELRAANLPRATTLGTFTMRPKDGSEMNAEHQAEVDEMVAAMDPYLASFVPFQPTCISCGGRLVGGLMEFGSGLLTFEWGICYGEGKCGACGWPCRVIHETDKLQWNMTLQYHPDQVDQQPRGEG